MSGEEVNEGREEAYLGSGILHVVEIKIEMWLPSMLKIKNIRKLDD